MTVVRARRPSAWLQVLLVVAFVWAYDEVRALHGDVARIAVHDGWQVLSVDRLLHLAVSPAVNEWLRHYDLLGKVLAGYYFVMHLGATGLTLLVLYLRSDGYRRHRNALFAASVVALVVFWVYPVAPPRLLPGFHDIVRAALPVAYHLEVSAANRYAALPSLHVAWAVWVAWASWSVTRRPLVRTATVAHAAITAFAVLATGNHYVLDVLTGALLVPVGYLVARLAGGSLTRLRALVSRPLN